MEEKSYARENAEACLENIHLLVEALKGDGEALGKVREDYGCGPDQAILEYPLSVEVRTEWHSVGSDDAVPKQYKLLLTTGGPACHIVGDLDEYNEPETARLEYQNWYTPWTQLSISDSDEEALLTFARQFSYYE